MKNKTVRIIICVVAVLIVMMSFSMTAFAAGDVAGAIEQTWNTTLLSIRLQHRL